MKRPTSVLIALLFFLSDGPTFAEGDAAAGKAKSAVCAACHGPEGISASDIWPNLAGQKAVYMANQIKAVRDGKRDNPLMLPVVKNLSDQDIDDLAAYYSGLSACK